MSRSHRRTGNLFAFGKRPFEGKQTVDAMRALLPDTLADQRHGHVTARGDAIRQDVAVPGTYAPADGNGRNRAQADQGSFVSAKLLVWLRRGWTHRFA